MNAYDYSITIRRVMDKLFEATITELPDAVEYATTPGKAYELAIKTIEGAFSLYKESGRDFPSPGNNV